MSSVNTHKHTGKGFTNLRSVWVGNSLSVNPIFWLLVLRVIDFLGRVDRWIEVLEQAASVLALTVEADVVGVVGAENKTRR